MNDFTVIEGGGKPTDHNADIAKQAFAELGRKIIRSLARGEDHSGEIVNALVDF